MQSHVPDLRGVRLFKELVHVNQHHGRRDRRGDLFLSCLSSPSFGEQVWVQADQRHDQQDDCFHFQHRCAQTCLVLNCS